jgi:hypothetical protein
MPQVRQGQAIAVHHKKKSQSLAQGDWLFFLVLCNLSPAGCRSTACRWLLPTNKSKL